MMRVEPNAQLGLDTGTPGVPSAEVDERLEYLYALANLGPLEVVQPKPNLHAIQEVVRAALYVRRLFPLAAQREALTVIISLAQPGSRVAAVATEGLRALAELPAWRYLARADAATRALAAIYFAPKYDFFPGRH